MKILGYKIEKDKDLTIEELSEIVDKMGYRLVKKTIDKTKKIKSASQATKAKIKITKEKIENGINLLKLENRTINYKNLTEVSGVSFPTLKKYLPTEKINELNTL